MNKILRSAIFIIGSFSVMFVIASFSLSQVYAEPIIYDDDYIIEKFVTGLQYPTTMTFVGKEILVLEKNTGNVIRIQDNGIAYNELALDVPVIFSGESGLLGIAFASNHIYLYFTESLSGFDKYDHENARNAVYQYDWNGENLTNPILIKELPALHPVHTGGVITKGQNNEIYFVIGDQDQYTAFQNIPEYRIVAPTAYETGSIFKIDTESNNSVELFAMGIRNSFGLAVDPVTGYLWDTENGLDKFDEINLVKPRFNSGWRLAMGPVVDSSIISQPFENFVYSDPEFSWYVTVAPTAIAFPDKDGFGKHSDSLFVGDFKNGRIYNFQLNLDRTGFVFSNPELSDLVLDDNDKIDEILFASGFQGVVDIKFHDDSMYVVSIGDGSIYKIYPKNPLPPLKQYQNGVTHKKIVCEASLMPIMSKSGYIYCVQPKTALTLINVLNWSIDHHEMPKIELRHQNFQGLNFEYTDLSNSDF
ncbi:MAG: PQQ-dependent sugar dehydrogenase, partial [Candidatus Nitrosopelagicus sp.]